MLSNRFNVVDKARVWIDHPYCVNCHCNSGCSLHHIYGCKFEHSDSICNSIMLCFLCHKEADGQNTCEMGNPLRLKYLKLALMQVGKSDHFFNYKDKGFLQTIKEDVDKVLQ